MAQPLLVMRILDQSTVGVYRLNGTEITQIGNGFGTRELKTFSNRHHTQNRAVHWQGKIYAVLDQEIYVYDPDQPSMDWVLSHTFGVTVFGATGLYPITISGVPHLACVMGVTAEATCSFRGAMFDGATWTESATTVPAFTGDAREGLFKSSIVFDNKLYFVATRNSSANVTVGFYDPVTNSVADLGSPDGNDNAPYTMGAYQNDLYFLGSSSSSPFLWRLNGTQVAVVGAPPGGTLNASNRTSNVLFTDGDFMYGMWNGGGGTYSFSQFNGSASGTDLTSTVLPTALTSGVTVNSRAHVFLDQQGNPGGKPEVYIYVTENNASPSDPATLYRWRGPNQLLEDLGSIAGVGRLIFCDDTSGGGHRIHYINDSGIDLVSAVNLGGSYRLRISLPNASGSPTNVRGWFNDEQEHPRNPMTIVSTTAGVLGTDGIVTGLVPPVTFDVVWDVNADNIIPGEVPGFVLEEFSADLSEMQPDEIDDLRIWLDASDAATIGLNGGDVATWIDKSINGIVFPQVTPANQPLYEIAAQNGLNAVNYSVGDVLEGLPPSDLLSDNVGDIFVVVEANTLNVISLSALNAIGDPGNSLTVRADNAAADRGPNIIVGVGGVFDSVAVDNQSISSGVPFVFNVATNGSAWFLEQDGAIQTVSVEAGSNSGDWFADLIGLDLLQIGGNNFDGKIYEIIVYGKVLTLAERQRITNYLSRKWGI